MVGKLIVLVILNFIVLSSYGNFDRIKFNSYAELTTAMESILKIMNDDSVKAKELESEISGFINEINNDQLKYSLEIVLLKYKLTQNLQSENFVTEVTEIINQTREKKLKYHRSEALQLLADYYWHMQNYSSALEYYFYAHNLYENFTPDEFPQKADFTYELAGRYYYFNDFLTAKNYLLQIYNTIPEEKNTKLLPGLNNLALSYSHLHQYDSSEHYFKIAEKIAIKSNQEIWIALLRGNIANNYFDQGKYDEAEPLLEDDINLSLKHGEKVNAALSLAILGEIYRLRNESKKALELQQQAYNLILEKNKLDNYKVVSYTFPYIAAAYAANGDMTKAYEFLKRGTEAKDSLALTKNQLYLAGAQHKVEAEKHRTELMQKELQISRKNIIQYSSMSGFVLVLLLLFFVYRNFSNQRQSNRKLKEAQEQIIRNEKMAVYGAMASRLAHEIQNPLNFVNNFSRVSDELVNEIMNSESRENAKETATVLHENLQRIIHHGKRVEEIVKQLQEHSRSGTAMEYFEEN